MKKIYLLVASLFVGTALMAQTSSGIDPKNLDTSVRPGDDFFQYAAGGWMKSHPLDAEHPMNGAFVDLSEQNTLRIQELILQYAGSPIWLISQSSSSTI